jgi:thymidylate synthase (FAD)
MLTLRTLTAEQQAEIDALRDATTTSRLTVPALEDVMYRPFAALDHGFIRVVDYAGGDASVVQAARVSYGKGTKATSDDRGLIRYLMSHWHSTPFEMPSITFHVKLPIFVARQWIRTRTASTNEYSGRYSILDREFYLPAPEHLAQQSTINNQGRGETLTPEQAKQVLLLLSLGAEQAYNDYEEMIDPEGINLARELARMNLPVNFYTQWYWKIDAHNLMNFLRLRNDSHAQYEIRVYAEIMQALLERWMPLTAEAFRDYRQDSYNLSAPALDVVRKKLAGETIDQADSGLSRREWRELMKQLHIPDS